MVSHRYSSTNTVAGQGTQVQITGSHTYAKHYPEKSRVADVDVAYTLKNEILNWKLYCICTAKMTLQK